jgi:hypothetical protein
MTGEQVVLVAAAGIAGVLALLGALIVWRTLSGVGRGLRSANDRLAGRDLTIAAQLASTRERLAQVDAQAEPALWTLGNLDVRIDRARVDLRSKRVSSDRLRLRMLEGRLTIARLRQLVRLMIRLNEMRRVFL